MVLWLPRERPTCPVFLVLVSLLLSPRDSRGAEESRGFFFALAAIHSYELRLFQEPMEHRVGIISVGGGQGNTFFRACEDNKGRW